jgi:glycylpeptide N-tetradecanoyltransferase
LNIAYSFYNVPGKYSMTELISDALIIAKNKGYDVFNALDV